MHEAAWKLLVPAPVWKLLDAYIRDAGGRLFAYGRAAVWYWVDAYAVALNHMLPFFHGRACI